MQYAQDALAANVTQEQGKTLADAKGDVFRGLGMYFQCQQSGICSAVDLTPQCWRCVTQAAKALPCMSPCRELLSLNRKRMSTLIIMDQLFNRILHVCRCV